MRECRRWGSWTSPSTATGSVGADPCRHRETRTPHVEPTHYPRKPNLEAVHGHLDRELLVVVGQHDAEVADLLARLTCAERRGPNRLKIEKETSRDLVCWTRVTSTKWNHHNTPGRRDLTVGLDLDIEHGRLAAPSFHPTLNGRDGEAGRRLRRPAGVEVLEACVDSYRRETASVRSRGAWTLV